MIVLQQYLSFGTNFHYFCFCFFHDPDGRLTGLVGFLLRPEIQDDSRSAQRTGNLM